MTTPPEDLRQRAQTKNRFTLRAFLGVALVAWGLVMVLPRPYHERNYLIDAGGCRLQTTVYEPAATMVTGTPASATAPAADERGTVVLYQGLAANRKIMAYLAEGFALEGLRVFVPDLPGHGRTEGPFSAARAEECSENLVHELRSRGMAQPERTILAGHSMGAAIAIRVAAHVPVAGVIAISPAPMRAMHGVLRDLLLFEGVPPLPPNAEVISGGLEPAQMTANARDLLQPQRDVNSHYDIVPWATHAGLLWRPEVIRLGQDWAAKILRLDGQKPGADSEGSTGDAGSHRYAVPSRWPLAGCVLGLMGFFMIAGPFLREAATVPASNRAAIAEADQVRPISWWRAVLELLAVGVLVVVLLRYWQSYRWARLFEGDYLTAFLLFCGLLLIVVHRDKFVRAFDFRSLAALKAIFAAIVLFLMFSAWFELSVTEAWLDSTRWQRFPLLCIALIPCLVAEEILLGPPGAKGDAKSVGKRVVVAILYRLVLWLALLFGMLALHSGEILLVLLSPYFLFLSIAQRRGMDVVREVTGSAAAAALFGAILLTGFFLVVFPLL